MTAQSKMFPVLLLTRPEAASRRFAMQFHDRFGPDFSVVIAPLMEIVALAPPIPEAQALIFTSQNAVTPLVALSPAMGRRAYCVGARTADVARKAGFEVIEGPGDARTLMPMIAKHHQEGRLLHARGVEVAVAVADILSTAGFETLEAVVYRQEARPIAPDSLALLRKAGVILAPVFSPKSARLLAGLGLHRLQIAAISPSVAEACAEIGPDRLEIAPSPDAEGILEALARLIGSGNAA
ncbi:uroporphyrinogen-III synthase [Sedimentimonas flavescens]|uniref:uroporphyrinogen-III synthase n=1 Tax=Sedimentimonas flavescens TaxID=2851012 RepID=UPI001C4A6807|nr:uroporphyrinogen-III synthase [Sedimentimonas flavescens]MBW0158281.1 uroporphyrinogen-III synthase [Sedimentimonas flavescens]MCT2539589.1 uroporphyrinogen-III synthase [Sedimentimonas flavescens]